MPYISYLLSSLGLRGRRTRFTSGVSSATLFSLSLHGRPIQHACKDIISGNVHSLSLCCCPYRCSRKTKCAQQCLYFSSCVCLRGPNIQKNPWDVRTPDQKIYCAKEGTTFAIFFPPPMCRLGRHHVPYNDIYLCLFYFVVIRHRDAVCPPIATPRGRAGN